jgi:hypothetical protein
MTDTTKLTTTEAITHALYELAAGYDRHCKPAQRKAYCARMADLYELRAALWTEAYRSAVWGEAAIPDVYRQACIVAEAKDREMIRYWRGQA